MAKRALKKNSKIVLTLLGVIVCIALVFGISKLLGSKSPDSNNSQSQSQMLQGEEDLELIIPEDQDTGGF